MDSLNHILEKIDAYFIENLVIRVNRSKELDKSSKKKQCRNVEAMSPVGLAMRPASAGEKSLSKVEPLNVLGKKITIVDLNNFATFPTLAIGILVASLRNAGHEVEVICPLAYDVPAAQREKRETWYDHVYRRIHLSTWAPFRIVRDSARDLRFWWNNFPNRTVLKEIAKVLDNEPDIILLSAYLQHYRTVVKIGKLAQTRTTPMLLGGPMFNIPDIVDAWLDVPGLTAIFGGEVELVLPDLICTVCEGGNLLDFDGITLPNGNQSPVAAPLKNLDRVPIPDFSDFPWDRYPVRIVPVMTGRGCQWNDCVFCSDVISGSGRTFRTRSVENLMLELREQALRHQTANFLFLDLKLNSNPAMLRGIVEHIQSYVPGAQWVGTVHVDLRKDNGLSRRELRVAVTAGMRRVSFGLETGSQRLLDEMQKGSSVAVNSTFIRNAYEVGLSIRCTMFCGFPGETAEDLELTADFLEQHEPYLDRVRFNAFSIVDGTLIYKAIREKSPEYPQVQLTKLDHKNARARYRYHDTSDLAYRRAKARALRAVYEINRKKVRLSARAFDGLM